MTSGYRLNRSVVSTSVRTGRLDLHGLSLDAIPDDLFTYPALIQSLTSIDLSHNRIKTLTPSIKDLTKLKTLALDGNLLSSLPIELAELPSLKVISLEGNPLPEELMSVYARAKISSGSEGREASSLIAKLISMEEREIHREEQKLMQQIATIQGKDFEVGSESRPMSASSDTDSLTNEMNRIDSRAKQASLSSHIFSPNRGESVASTGAKKHSHRSHEASHVFSVASEPISSHSSKRVNLQPSQKHKSPFGTDTQEEEEFKPRRIPNYEVANEKENEATSLSIGNFENNSNNNKIINAGKRIMKTEMKPAPFGTIDSSFYNGNGSNKDFLMSSNQHSQKQFDEARKALESINIDGQSSSSSSSSSSSPRMAAGRSDSQQSFMKSLLSQENSSSFESINGDNFANPNANQKSEKKHSVRILEKQSSHIFDSSPILDSIRSSGSSAAPRSTSPWARDDEPQHVSSKGRSNSRHQSVTNDNIFGGQVADMQRTGRARIQPSKKDNSIFD